MADDGKRGAGTTAGGAGGGPPGITTMEEGWNKIYPDGIVKLREMVAQHGPSSETKTEERKLTFTNKEYMALYTTIYDMCIQKAPFCYTPQLYEQFGASFTEYLTETALPAIQAKHEQYMLQELVNRWGDHKIMARWMCSFFRYLDRFYVKRHSKKPLDEVAVTLFRELVFEPMHGAATQAILTLVEADRKDQQVDRYLLRQAIEMYVDLGMQSTDIYKEKFEEPFLEATRVFYSRDARSWLESDSCPAYLRKAERRIEEEKQRVEDFLHPSTARPLTDVLHQTLLVGNQTQVLNKESTGVKVMLQQHAVEDFSRMYKLYSAVPSLEPIATIVREFITNVGLSLLAKVDQEKAYATYIEELIKIHDKYYSLVLGPFESSPIFHKTLKEAFENVVNRSTKSASTAELLAVYADRLLRKGGIRLSETQLEETLEKVVRLFSYLTDKDMFSEFYRKSLAKRLLLQRSASSDAEQSMIGKLKLRCGAQFTSKLEGMINDMRRGDEHKVAFKHFLTESSITLDLEFTVQVLTTGFWPAYGTEEVTLDPSLNKCMDVFKQYYNNKTSNRRLRWTHALGTVTLAGNFPRKRVDLTICTPQAAILLLFNHNKELPIEGIIKMTGMKGSDVKKYLRSLVSGSHKVLLKKPAEGYSETHTICVNEKFTSQQRRIRIAHVVSKTSASERKQSQSAVGEDRRHAIEANIVRVMKARKTLDHASLIAEVSQQLMQFFRPDPRQIKKRIEDLIAREYLERDAQKTSVYHYLA